MITINNSNKSLIDEISTKMIKRLNNIDSIDYQIKELEESGESWSYCSSIGSMIKRTKKNLHLCNDDKCLICNELKIRLND